MYPDFIRKEIKKFKVQKREIEAIKVFVNKFKDINDDVLALNFSYFVFYLCIKYKKKYYNYS